MMKKRRVERLTVHDVAGRVEIDAEVLMMKAALAEDQTIDDDRRPRKDGLRDDGGTNPANAGRGRSGPGR
jgi:hypothetical protein